MDFKSLLSQLDQLNEATEKTKTGIKHTADAGGYGRKDDEDDEGNKVKPTAVKKGKGRPKKDADASGETKKYDFSAFGVKSGKDVKLPKYDKKKSTVVKGKSQSHASNKVDDGTDPGEEPKAKKKGSLKEYFDALDQAMLAEAEQIQIKPASQMPKQPGQTSMQKPGQPQQVAGQPQKQTQVIAQGNKTLGTVDNPQLAQQIKQSIGKGEMTLMPEEQVNELSPGTIQSAAAKRDAQRPDQMSQATQRKDPMVHATNRINMNNRPAEMDEDFGTTAAIAGGAALGTALGAVKGRYGDMKQREQGHTAYTPDEHKDKPRTMVQRLRAAAGIPSKNDPNVKTNEEDIGKHNNANTGFDALVRKLTPKYGVEAAKRIAGAQLKKIREADQPPNDSLMSPISEARAKADDKAEKAGKKVTKDLEYDMKHKGKDDAKAEKAGKKVTKDIEYDEKKKTVKEAAKPDFLDLDKDGNKKEPMKKAATDKKKVKEGMDHRLKAARHMGKAHALTKEGYNCRYDDMEEAKHYHEGYKEGLDECYGQMPIQGYVGETTPPATVPGMANQAMRQPAMEDDLDEMDKGDWMKQKAKTTPGDTFKAFGQTFKDKEVVESPFAFEALEKQLNALLEGKEEVAEGMTVSISKGQQGMPDSVSVNAQDAEADQLLSIIKQAGLGLFGGDDTNPQSPAVSGDAVAAVTAPAEIEVVDDHDDMLSLMRKMSGQAPAQASGDYEEEGGDEAHTHEETCESCGCAMQEGHSCDETVEEDETMYQREEEVAEDESGGDDSEESDEVNSDATRDAALATAAGKNFADTDAPLEEGGDGGEAGTDAIAADDAADAVDAEEEDLDESYANSDDDQFETDIDFMTNVITGGLNGRKVQHKHGYQQGDNPLAMKESTDLLTDWRKLSGIK